MSTEPDNNVHEEPDGSLAHALRILRPVFDAAFYAAEYGDVSGDEAALLLHFCQRGWKEGRNPHAGFDTIRYEQLHADVVQVGWNPVYHFTLIGEAEGRQWEPAFRARAAAEAMLGFDAGDWVLLLRPELDAAFYAQQFDEPPDDSFDLVAHFAYRGWLEGRNPNPGFDTEAALANRPELRPARVNPLVAVLATPAADPPADEPVEDLPDEAPGLTVPRFPPDAIFGIRERLVAHEQALVRAAPAVSGTVESVVAGHMDHRYYGGTYPDVAAHGAHPADHYCRIGWKEGRNPTPWFDTAYYLRANPDVAREGVNPFWHYLVEGEKEGRTPQRPGGFRQAAIEQAKAPEDRARSYSRTAPKGVLNRSRIERVLREPLAASNGLVVSASHDCYVQVTGGIQLFIADEQLRFARQGLTYLHISPYVPLLTLADPAEEGTLVSLVLDGRNVGVASYTDLAAVLAAIPAGDRRRLFLAHCLLGHHLPDLAALQRATASTENVFWLHDYSSLCLGYTLLRNDSAYCHAPPPDSMACHICVYGEAREAHLAQMRRFFAAVPFDIAAPSEAALKIWRAHSDLPHRATAVHPHCAVVPTTDPAPERRPGQPVRIAFVGYARTHKGWPIWTELVRRTRHLGAYEYLHLGNPDTAAQSDGVQHVAVSTSPGQPDAMCDAIRDGAVDLVLVLSTWPETFSYVTYEAMAGGADVVCLAGSGNIADAVLKARRGVVAEDEDSLYGFFSSLRAVEYVRLCREEGTPGGHLVRNGTTATLALAQA